MRADRPRGGDAGGFSGTASHEGATGLPAILPMVVHHSPAGWTAPMQFAELLDLDAHGLQLLHHVHWDRKSSAPARARVPVISLR